MSALVYITSHGGRYHTDRHFMTGSAKVWITAKEAEHEGYVACAHCCNGQPKRPALGRDPSKAFLRLHRSHR